MKTALLLFAIVVGALHCQASVAFVDNINANFHAYTYPALSYDLDFDSDGNWELHFTGFAQGEVFYQYRSTTVQTQAEVLGAPNPSFSVPLNFQTVIDAVPASFGQWESNTTGGYLLGVFSNGTLGYWQDFNDPNPLYFNGYLGVRFQKPDGWHYGWVNLDISRGGTGIVRSYAWETAPNTAIVAAIPSTPEPGRVALLLVGAVMCVMRRRR